MLKLHKVCMVTFSVSYYVVKFKELVQVTQLRITKDLRQKHHLKSVIIGPDLFQLVPLDYKSLAANY